MGRENGKVFYNYEHKNDNSIFLVFLSYYISFTKLTTSYVSSAYLSNYFSSFGLVCLDFIFSRNILEFENPII